MNISIPVAKKYFFLFYLLTCFSLLEVSGQEAGERDGDNPEFHIELGAETFYGFDQGAGSGLGGLAAIMIDMEGSIHERVSVFSAFHFDSSVWHDFMNKVEGDRQDLAFGYDIELEVEEFFITWEAIPGALDITAGRMFSVLSYANQLHLADFQFNMKPRIFTDYWGDNHGFALDGLSAKLYYQHGRLDASLITEAAKNGYESESLSATGVLDAAINLNGLNLGLRGFGYMDHQHDDHPFLYRFSHFGDVDYAFKEGLQLNAYGGGVNALWDTSPFFNSVFLQAEGVQRAFGDDTYAGGYAFVIFSHSERLETSFMYQQLEVPAWDNATILRDTEKAYIAGLSFFPWYNHRIRLEYHTYDNSMFYDNMLLLKYTFFTDLM